MNRRTLLKTLSLASGHWLLNSCSTLDSLFLGESGNLRNRVVIIGGGLSGLLTAYYLKKRKIPFFMFEASNRLGGQIITIDYFYKSGIWIDLGIEGYYEEDEQFRNLIKQLNIEEIVFNYNQLIFKSDKTLSILKKAHQIAKNKMKNSLNDALISQLSLHHWALTVLNDPLWLNAVNDWSLYRTGYASTVTPAYPFIKSFLRSFLHPWKQNQLCCYGGMESLIHQLNSEIFGPFAESYLKLEYQLVEIYPLKQNGWDLIFQTPKGKRRFEAEHIILAFNPWLIPSIKGATNWLDSSYKKPFCLEEKWIFITNHKTSAIYFQNPPQWIRRYVQKGAWGQIQAEKYIQFQFFQPHINFKNISLEKNMYYVHWENFLYIKGRSLGNIIAHDQPQFKLPKNIYSTHQIMDKINYQMSFLDALVNQTRTLTEHLQNMIKIK